MLVGAPLIPVVAIGWVVLAPVPFDARELFMLVGAAVTGMFVFHALGLWATIYGPRRGNYNQSLGNDLSLVGNIVVIGGIFTFLFGTQVVARLAPSLLTPGNWWISLVEIALALCFYIVSLQAVEKLFRQRREQLMAVVEGRG